MNKIIPIYLTNNSGGSTSAEPSLVPEVEIPENPEERLKKFEDFLITAKVFNDLATAVSICAGLVLLRIEAEQLYRTRTINDEAGDVRPMTLAEYYASANKSGCGTSPSTVSRSRKGASIWLNLREHGVEIQMLRGHVLPLGDLAPVHQPTVMKKVIEKTGGNFTADDVEEAVCDFNGRKFVPRASATKKLKRSIRDLVSSMEAALEIMDKDALVARLGDLRQLVSEKPFAAKKIKKGSRTKTNGIVITLPADPVVENEGVKEAPQLVRPASDEPITKSFGPTIVRLNGKEIVAFHKPFDRQKPPASDKVIRDRGLPYVGQKKGLFKAFETPELAAIEFEILCKAVEESLISK